MAKIRQILKHISVEYARGNRRCRRNRQHTIRPGEPCLVIQDDCGPYARNYCLECARPILEAGESRITEVQSQLRGCTGEVRDVPHRVLEAIGRREPLSCTEQAQLKVVRAHKNPMQVTWYDASVPYEKHNEQSGDYSTVES